VPSFGEKLIIAFTRRRELLAQMGELGLRVVGPGRCRATSMVREFLYKNFVPFTWFDTETEAGRQALAHWARRARRRSSTAATAASS
jgi:thioredoxin reductase (NADPH)